MTYEYFPAPKPPNRHGLSHPRLFREDPAEARERIPTEDRWPRGYTPERRDEVRRSMLDMDVYGAGSTFNLIPARGDYPGQQPPRERTTSAANVEATKRGVIDAVARSNVPVDELKSDVSHKVGAAEVTVESPRYVIKGTDGVRGQVQANPELSDQFTKIYSQTAEVSSAPPRPRGVSPEDTKRLEGADRARGEHVLLHEIGHTVSNRRLNAHSSVAGHVDRSMGGSNDWERSPSVRGTEEAFADTYAFKNHNLDPRDAKRGLNRGQFHNFQYDAGNYYTDFQTAEREQFTDSYERKTAGVREQAKQEEYDARPEGTNTDGFTGRTIGEIMDMGMQRLPGLDWHGIEKRSA